MEINMWEDAEQDGIAGAGKHLEQRIKRAKSWKKSILEEKEEDKEK